MLPPSQDQGINSVRPPTLRVLPTNFLPMYRRFSGHLRKPAHQNSHRNEKSEVLLVGVTSSLANVAVFGATPDQA